VAAGSTKAEAHVQTIYIGVAKLVFVVVALLLMDRVGRKPLLVVGCAGMAVSSALLAASYQLPNANMLAVASLVLYMAFFEISLGPILWLLLSELYPLPVKGVAMSIGSTMTWLMT
jgi:MFS family permease